MKTGIEELIEQTNQEFETASPERKRVMIAEDAIERLRRGLIEPLEGSLFANKNEKGSVKEFVNKKTCEVCIKGGIFCSYIGRVNRLDFKDIRKITNGDLLRGNDSIHTAIEEIFSRKQLSLMETAFEGDEFMDELDLESDIYYRAVTFHQKYDSVRERFIAICSNIIKNNGEFIP